mgnify:CR=1 FL=1
MEKVATNSMSGACVESEKRDIVADHDESLCWFCKRRPASDEAIHWVNLHRVLDRKQTYIVLGIEYKQRYVTTKTGVPRCCGCKSLHDKVGTAFGIVWLVCGLLAAAWVLKNPEVRQGSVLENIVRIAVGVPVLFALCAFPVYGVYFLVGVCWKSEGYACEHPSVKALTAAGWEAASKPGYKW